MDIHTIKSGRWSDPSIWHNGSVPKTCCHVNIHHSITIDVDAFVSGLHIVGVLQFQPNKSVTLRLRRNIVVHGRLVMKPSGYSRIHTIEFIDVNEAAFVGGGMEVIDSDTGLWVMHNGALELEAAPRERWTSGSRLFNALDDDYIISTPGGFEKINTTSNVIIKGTPDGHAHIFIHSSSKQIIRYVKIEYMGAKDKVGRYALHFHHCHTLSQTDVTGVICIHCNNHAFVPHASEGIFFHMCAAVSTVKDAYWWDQPADKFDRSNDSHNITYMNCIAAYTYGEYSTASFLLGSGTNNRCINCVATGNYGKEGSAGFLWPEDSNQTPNVWEFFNCLAHNNKQSGGRSWQNDWNLHKIVGFVSIHNRIGFDYGAYRNGYHFEYCKFQGNSLADFIMHALPSPNATEYDGFKASMKYSIISKMVVKPHTLPGSGSFGLVDCEIGSLVIDELPARVPSPPPSQLEFIDCKVDHVQIIGMEKGTQLIGVNIPN